MLQKPMTTNSERITFLMAMRLTLVAALARGKVQTAYAKLEKHAPGYLKAAKDLPINKPGADILDPAHIKVKDTCVELVCKYRSSKNRSKKTSRTTVADAHLPFICFDKCLPSYSFADAPLVGHVALIAEELGHWAGQLFYFQNHADVSREFPVMDCVEQLIATRGLPPGAYLQAYVINFMPPPSFAVEQLTAAVEATATTPPEAATGAVRIAVHYVLAQGSDEVWNVFFGAKKLFVNILGRGKELIELVTDFNEQPEGVPVASFQQILENLRCPGRVVYKERDGHCYQEIILHIDEAPVEEEIPRIPLGQLS